MRRLCTISLSLALVVTPCLAQQSAQPSDHPQPAGQSSAKVANSPKVRNQVEPKIPREARRKHISGLCVVSLSVDTEGIPRDLHIKWCSDPSFEKPSLEALAKYRFDPATTQDRKPVPAKLSIEINFRLGRLNRPNMPQVPIRCESNPPPDAASQPSANGVYALTQAAVPPTLTWFSDEGYAATALTSEKKGACDILITIGVNGKASEAKVAHCQQPVLEEPAVQSLLDSKYKPGRMNGKAVPMRASIHLEYNGDENE